MDQPEDGFFLDKFGCKKRLGVHFIDDNVKTAFVILIVFLRLVVDRVSASISNYLYIIDVFLSGTAGESCCKEGNVVASLNQPARHLMSKHFCPACFWVLDVAPAEP